MCSTKTLQFIQRRRIEFDSLANLFEQAKGYEKVVVNKGEYLEDILKSKLVLHKEKIGSYADSLELLGVKY